jgi:hypothetical protein
MGNAADQGEQDDDTVAEGFEAVESVSVVQVFQGCECVQGVAWPSEIQYHRTCM